MRILQVDKFLRRQGGAASYMLDLAALQRDAGNVVEFFAMADQRNEPARYSADFAPHLDTDPPPPGLRAQSAAAARMVWNPPAAHALDRVVSNFRPDVVHLHNIYHQLSPSVLRPLHRRGIRAVMTLHDYKLVCPTYKLLDLEGPCTRCLDGHFRHAVERRCKDGSRAASAVLAAETAIHRRLGLYEGIAAFIAPSRFLQHLLGESGAFAGRVHHVPHFIDLERSPRRTGAGGGVVFAGRLSREKGVDDLVRAVGAIPRATLAVVGDGPERGSLQALAEQLAPGRVCFHGFLSREATLAIVAESRVAVLPARWHENQPMSVLEAMSCGVPCVVTSLGGAPELVEEGVTGRIVPPNDPAALADALRQLLAEPALARGWGEAGRAVIAERFSPAEHLRALDELYSR